jgi:hypothetical protein
MSSYLRLASASLAATVALVVAACTPATTATSGSTSAPAAAATSGAATTATPESSGSPSPQASGDYPLAPGGVTFNGGEGGGLDTFSIRAGNYSLNQQATYDPSNDPDGTDQCQFDGELDWVPGGSSGVIPLGDSAFVTDGVPLDLQAKAPYPAGDYRLYVYSNTTCSWTIELWPTD